MHWFDRWYQEICRIITAWLSSITQYHEGYSVPLLSPNTVSMEEEKKPPEYTMSIGYGGLIKLMIHKLLSVLLCW